MTIGNITVAQDSGIHTIDVSINSDASDSIFGIIAEFQLTAGIFTSPPGTFGGAGFVGEGNYEPAPFSGFERDPGDFTLAQFSGEFTNIQPIPAANGLLLQMSIDVSGVGPGTYSIAGLNLLALDGAGDPVTITAIDGSFTVQGVTAVPEPGSMAVLGLVVAAGAGRAALRRRRKADAAAEGQAT